MGKAKKVVLAVLVLELLAWRSGGEVEGSSITVMHYKDALAKAILFFEGQRSGRLPPEQRVRWRGDSALTDGLLENVDLVGGYYDAGDNVKFGWPMSFTTSLLSWAAIDYRREITSAHQICNVRESIRWAADFILKAHVSPTTLYTQVGDGDSDHRCWERPEDMDTPRTLQKITPSSPGTEAAADASAALASASVVFKHVDRNYSSLLLASAKSLFDFANSYRGSYQSSCPFYCSYSGYQDELLWAATWLYKATRESQYMDFIVSNMDWSEAATEFSWDNKLPGVQAILGKEFMAGNPRLGKYKNDADLFVCSLMPKSDIKKVQLTPGGLLFTRDCANLQFATGAAFQLLFYSQALQSFQIDGVQCGSVHIPSAEIADFGKSQVDYILGKNPLGMSYMVGFGNRYPLQVHHRGSSIPSVAALPLRLGCDEGFSQWFSSQNPNPNVHVGAVVGGPDSDDRFDDVRSDANHLEPTTYMNAAFVGALAGLLSYHGSMGISMEPNASMSLPISNI